MIDEKGQKRKKEKAKEKKRTVGVQPLVGSSTSFFSQMLELPTGFEPATVGIPWIGR